jgi:osmotically-inducible protein OsmY
MHKPDGLLEYDVREMLSSDPRLDDGRVLVKVSDGLVSLSGAVASFEESARAAQDAGSVRGVTGVDNRLWVGPVAGAIEDRMVRAGCLRALERESHVPTGSVSVSVEDGLVTLRGTAHHHFQAAAAKRAVATVDGVKGIVDNIIIVSDPIPGDVAARIEGALRHKEILDGAHIEVSCQGGTVFLDGTVGSWAALREAEDVAWNAPGASQVVDRLVVAGGTQPVR